MLDVADESAVNAFAQDVLREHGRVTIVANNAGVSIFGTVQELATDEIAWLMNVNFWGVVYGTKAFLPALLAQPEACIVNTSACSGCGGRRGSRRTPRASSRCAASARRCAASCWDRTCTCVTVHPGGIKTAIARSSRVARAADAELAAKMAKKFDERFLTTPPEVMAAAIVDGIKRKRDRVVAGTDAPRIDVLTRLFPTRAARWFNRRARGLREATRA